MSRGGAKAGEPMAGFQHRQSPKDGPEDFPTPPWATRALMEHVLEMDRDKAAALTCWEPAANRGYMVTPLREYFGTVIGTDRHDYGAGFPVVDFLKGPDPRDYGMLVDWIVTNPPFNAADDFVKRALTVAGAGVAIFARTAFIEGLARWRTIFSANPPSIVAQFAERVPVVAGKVDPKARTAMPYAWFVWDQRKDAVDTLLMWIPQCRKELERDGDYPEVEGPVGDTGDVAGDDQPEKGSPEAEDGGGDGIPF